jgi:hypothetical protein
VLVSVERITDGSAETKHVVGVEDRGVVDDAVVMGLGTEKEASPHSVLDAAAQVQEKVIAVEMEGSTGGIVAGSVGVIEQHALASDASHEVGVGPFGQVGREHGVEVVHHGSILLIVVVEPVMVAKGNFRAVAEMVLENAVEADAGIESALLGRGQVSLGSRGVLGGL